MRELKSEQMSALIWIAIFAVSRHLSFRTEHSDLIRHRKHIWDISLAQFVNSQYGKTLLKVQRDEDHMEE